MTDQKQSGERIAKVIARAGICSRRDAERLIEEGKVKVDGVIIKSPAMNVTYRSKVFVEGKPLPQKDMPRLWMYHKPDGLVTTHSDPEGRKTVFESLPSNMPRVISIGRLDLNSEGLLLLTNDGELARKFELPSSEIERTYRVRVYGKPKAEELEKLKNGITLEGVKYGSVVAEIEREQNTNTWLKVTLREGKNREIRKIFEHMGFKVNRLIRVSFGAFELGKLEPGRVKEVPWKTVTRLLRAIESGNIEGLNQKDDKNRIRKTPRKTFGSAKNRNGAANRRKGARSSF